LFNLDPHVVAVAKKMLSHLLNRGGWVSQHGLFLRATNPSHIRKPVMAAIVPAVWAMFAAIRLASSLVSNFTDVVLENILTDIDHRAPVIPDRID
jgi:hypothetical protein